MYLFISNITLLHKRQKTQGSQMYQDFETAIKRCKKTSVAISRPGRWPNKVSQSAPVAWRREYTHPGQPTSVSRRMADMYISWFVCIRNSVFSEFQVESLRLEVRQCFSLKDGDDQDGTSGGTLGIFCFLIWLGYMGVRSLYFMESYT